ncbi:PNUTS [Leishmania donovani]|uniref:Hypothetical_protein_conserved n=1 Tax=Leishmania donovani TaxID=5661 RepID=A0A504Y9J8_LEIDO|nr:hypothetical protein CGC20_10760 [Leishmania donovani]CAJ1992120.1 PNUTS [Leishmania donovani]VDZ47957.1 hypothetical_protein_conserved [Leishmania donovani]
MSVEELQPSSPVAVNDDAEDVVEAELVAYDAHHTHLVEGDFFPAEAPEVEADGAVADATEEVDALVDAIAAEAAAVAAVSVVSTPPKPAEAPSRKRVCWADEGHTDTARGLVKHVTNFYMPNTFSRGSRYDAADQASPTRPTNATAVNPTPPLFREKVNSDETRYKFCKAQRPALQYAEWRRQQHEYGATPFELQPVDAGQLTGSVSIATRTLFGELFQRSVVARVAEGQVRTRNGTHHNSQDNGFQQPFVRIDATFDEPLPIPL